MFLSGQMVYTVRQRCGAQLALEAAVEADVVSTVPESATPSAIGYAKQVTYLHVRHSLHITAVMLLQHRATSITDIHVV